MIVDLRLAGRRAVVVGGGRQAARRIRALSGEGCSITVVAAEACPAVQKMAGAGRVRLIRRRVRGAGFIPRMRPHLVVAATGDGALNAEIAAAARRAGALAYRSDDASDSDFANAAVARVGSIRAAIFTGGRSPAVSRRLRIRAERAIRGEITGADSAMAQVQEAARRAARGAIPTQAGRRRYLRRVEEDPEVDRLIRAGRQAAAGRRAVAMLGET
ncbi:MAG: hypothetical protein MPI95_01345 [Nitrosopumilus sp.]|nr:hypothetical protein [Nitrosopumilus sp.]CAI9832183.1 putative Siroheme synthase domain protein [Nitrosopumilaceae archaeon]MDA7941322.1 hypothetical protein [Nitrosopumilus sp.]MDA7942733.1 hypothetical protein [Nitrosopumilus sp.]MDA7945617.1 hypothetical protein [Nitrosopumilus sp.]